MVSSQVMVLMSFIAVNILEQRATPADVDASHPMQAATQLSVPTVPLLSPEPRSIDECELQNSED
jgi:hypothetical protein